MSQIRADNITNRQGTGAPIFVNGIRVTGLTSISNMVANTGTFSGAVSIGGTLTYEDVTNVDAVGLITARSGIKVTGGGINAVGVVTATSFSGNGANLTGIDATSLKDGSGNVKVQANSDGVEVTGILTAINGVNVLAGISTFKGANFNGGSLIKEKCYVVAGKLSDTPNIDLENGMIQLYTTADTTICTPDLRMSGSKTLNSVMDVGDTIVVTLMSTAGASAYSANVTIDTAAVTEKWIGGAAPTGGGSSGIDTYSYTITKLSNTPTWNVIANLTNAA